MATIQDIMTSVQRELSYAGGRNVQVLMQDRIGNMINRQIRMLTTKYWWDDLFRTKIIELTGTGDVISNVKSEITRIKDVHSVYLNDSNTPLPWSPKGQNISQIRARSLYPAPTDNLPFMVLPVNETGLITINYRLYNDVDLNLDDDVPLDKDLLVLGTAASMAVSDGLNDTHAQKLLSEYNDQLKTLQAGEIKTKYVATSYGYDPITDWTPR